MKNVIIANGEVIAHLIVTQKVEERKGKLHGRTGTSNQRYRDLAYDLTEGTQREAFPA